MHHESFMPHSVEADGFRLLMLSAMYENGGNTTQRLLDGHPELAVYPFESQLGTRFVHDHLISLYPARYRWPEFPLSGSASDDFKAIIDEETRVRARTPEVSKFRACDFVFSDERRHELFLELTSAFPRTRPITVAAFFVASFLAWQNYASSGRESVIVGYSPIIAVDAETILSELPAAHVLHVVRNPWSAFADTKKRAVPLSPTHYMTAWTVAQYSALVAKQRFPDRMHICRYEDIVRAPTEVLGEICAKLGVGGSPTLAQPSWNGQPLAEVYPWGTIRTPTVRANDATAAELHPADRDEISVRAAPLLAKLGYDVP